VQEIEEVMKFAPPYFYRPDVCQCQLCIKHRADLEVQRVVNVLNSWPAGGVTRKPIVNTKPRLRAVKVNGHARA
jgi:hypothetical protein